MNLQAHLVTCELIKRDELIAEGDARFFARSLRQIGLGVSFTSLRQKIISM